MDREEQAKAQGPVPAVAPDAFVETSARKSAFALAMLAFILGGVGAASGLVGVLVAEAKDRPAFFFLLVTGTLACVLGAWMFRERLPALLALSGLAAMDAVVLGIAIVALVAAGQWTMALTLGSLLLLALGAFGVGLFWAAESENRTAEILRIVLLLGGMLGLMTVVALVVAFVLPASPSVALWFGTLVTVGGTIAGLNLFPMQGLGFGLPRNWAHAAWPIAAAAVLAWAASGYLHLMVAWLGPAILASQKGLDEVPTWQAILLFVLAAPVAEEILFRGSLQQTMKGMWGAPTAVLTAALLFGMVHFSPAALPAHLVLGLAAGLARELSGSLLPCILLHAVYNAIVVL